MAEDTVDLVCDKLGVTEACTTADAILPNQVPGKTYWLGHRLAEHEAEGGGDNGLLCECEFVTRPMLDAFLDRHPGCSLDDVRRGTRLGMGPCQGGFCTFRAAGVLGERAGGAGAPDVAELADRAILGFLRERFKGTRPIAAGRQLQEQWMISGVYGGGLGVESLIEHGTPDASGEVVGAQR
jgi:glycerol-3-phosphate dehydrogenase